MFLNNLDSYIFFFFNEIKWILFWKNLLEMISGSFFLKVQQSFNFTTDAGNTVAVARYYKTLQKGDPTSFFFSLSPYLTHFYEDDCCCPLFCLSIGYQHWKKEKLQSHLPQVVWRQDKSEKSRVPPPIKTFFLFLYLLITDSISRYKNINKIGFLSLPFWWAWGRWVLLAARRPGVCRTASSSSWLRAADANLDKPIVERGENKKKRENPVAGGRCVGGPPITRQQQPTGRRIR